VQSYMQIPQLCTESHKCERGQITQAECTENCHWEQRDGARQMPVQSNKIVIKKMATTSTTANQQVDS